MGDVGDGAAVDGTGIWSEDFAGAKALMPRKTRTDLLVRAIVCFTALAIAITTLTIIEAARETHLLPSGSTLMEMEYSGYILTDFEVSPETGRNGYEVHIDPQLAKMLSISVSRADHFAFYEPGSDVAALSLPGYWNISSFKVSDSALYHEDTQTFAFEWETSSTLRPSTLSLMPTEEFDRIIGYYQVYMYLFLGGICLLIPYCVSLYAFKRSEGYLLYFSIYLVCTLASGLMRIDVLQFSLLPLFPPSNTASLFAGMQMLAMLAMSYKLLGIAVPRPLRPVTTWQGVVLGGLAYYLVCGVSGSFAVAELLRFLMLGACAGPLMMGWAQERPGAVPLALFYAFKVGISWATISVGLGLFGTKTLMTLPLLLVRPLAFLDFPFIPACMIIVNYYFAHKFHEAEVLASELVRLNRSLDRQVDERTREVVETRDRQQAMMLNVFHDLRSPIFTVKGCIELVEHDPQKNRDMLAVAHERTLFLSDLTEDLFLLAKLETREIPIPFSRVDFSALVVTVAQSQKVAADAKGVTLGWDVREGIMVWGNAEQLGRMVQNVVVNAIQYTQQGRRVDVSVRSEAGDSVVLTVADQGSGIAPDELGHVFEKYYHSDRHGKSTGLGLAIAKEIAEIHRGSIGVQSVVGEGSTFVIDLPLLVEPACL